MNSVLITKMNNDLQELISSQDIPTNVLLDILTKVDRLASHADNLYFENTNLMLEKYRY
jgi:hypothetical protein